MIKLQQIKFQASSPQLTQKGIHKHLRISLKHIARTTTKSSKKPNQNSLIWAQPIYLPMLFGEEFLFEIYNEHRFGFNPQEIDEVYTGKLMISGRNQKQGVWEVQYNSQNIGYLTAKISSTPSVWQEQETLEEQSLKSTQVDSQPKTIKIKSIIASIPTIKGTQMWLQLKVGDTKVKTIHKPKCTSSQMVFLDEIQFYKPLTEYFLILNLYLKKAPSQKKHVGTAQLLFPVTTKKLYNERLVLRTKNEESAEIGELFLKYTSTVVPLAKISTMGDRNAEKYKQKLDISSKNSVKADASISQNDYFSKISQSRNHEVVQSGVKKLKNQVFIARKANEEAYHQSIRSQVLPKPQKMNLSSISETTPLATSRSYEIKRNHFKEISVVNPNKDVIFGQEERFPDGKQNTEFKYKINRSFDFSSSVLDPEADQFFHLRNDHSKGRKYYRGASIGKGYKTDFSKLWEKSPGVGSYKLPTIWDRYK